ncbi:MAG: hypothetical protein IKK10_02485 [Clostridia bacterium]|nr:hypothetical protein [Clostridia bacterium]
MSNTLRISFSLKNTYRVNSILYAIKQIPILKKILPDSLYRMIGFKIAGHILSWMWEVLSAIFGKAIYFGLLVGGTFLMGELNQASAFGEIFMHLFLFGTIIGVMSNTYMLSTHRTKYYAIMLLNVDARKYNIINYVYEILKLSICYVIAFVVLYFTAGIPLWLGLLSVLFTVGIKTAVVGYMFSSFEKGNDVDGTNPFNGFTFPLVILSAIMAGLFPAIGHPFPYVAITGVMAVFTVLGVFGLIKICKFNLYREVSRQTLLKAATIKTDSKKTVVTNTAKAISADTNITSNKKGFEFLNELFIKRHKKILWKPVLIISAIAFAIFAIANIAVLYLPESASEVNGLLLNSLPYFLFIMYAINRGMSYTQALFINCDHSLLTYSAYKKPKNILKLFTIRLREIVKMNLVPAFIIGAGLSALLFVSGGTDTPVNYLLLLFTPMAMSIFFSVHNLTIYYLLQPYNNNTEVKSGTYSIIMALTYAVCYIFMHIELPTLYFGLSIVGFSIIYCLVACLFVYKKAPETFRIRA